MNDNADPWAGTAGEWVPLAKLLNVVERELHVPHADAAQSLRFGLPSGSVQARIAGSEDLIHRCMQGSRRDWVRRDNAAPHSYHLSKEGWQHVDWTAGTLASFAVEVLWQDIPPLLLGVVVKQQNAFQRARSDARLDPRGRSDASLRAVAQSNASDQATNKAVDEVYRHAEASGRPGAEPEIATEPLKLPKFDVSRAHALLMAEKFTGIFANRIPTELETRCFLLKTFCSMANGPHRRLRKKLWPNNRPGPRTVEKAAK